MNFDKFDDQFDKNFLLDYLFDPKAARLVQKYFRIWVCYAPKPHFTSTSSDITG